MENFSHGLPRKASDRLDSPWHSPYSISAEQSVARLDLRCVSIDAFLNPCGCGAVRHVFRYNAFSTKRFH